MGPSVARQRSTIPSTASNGSNIGSQTRDHATALRAASRNATTASADASRRAVSINDHHADASGISVASSANRAQDLVMEPLYPGRGQGGVSWRSLLDAGRLTPPARST